MVGILKRLMWLWVIATSLGFAAPTYGTVLLFRPATGVFGDFAPLPAGYGNRVEAEVQDGFLYSLDGGPTPNITTYYNDGGDFPQLDTWANDYGDLQNVIFAVEPRVFLLALVADDGFVVTLNSFDMASWPHLDYVINAVAVYDQDGNVLYYDEQVPIYGAPDGPQHTSFTFDGATGTAIYIAFDSTNVDSDDVGITNINFSQDVAP